MKLLLIGMFAFASGAHGESLVLSDRTMYRVGSSISVKWKMEGGSAANDWIGLVRSGSDWAAGNEWKYTGGAANGTLTLKAPAAAGIYQLVLYPRNSYSEVARGPAISIGAMDAPDLQSPTPGQPQQPGPIALFTVNSACNDVFDDALVDVSLNLAAFAANERIGATLFTQNANQRKYRSEGFRQAYSNCKVAEQEYELALIKPDGNPTKAKISADAMLKSFRDYVVSVNNHPDYAFLSTNSVDKRWNGELRPRLLALLANIRQGEKYLKSSELLRKAIQITIDRSLEFSVACRVHEKTGKDIRECSAGVKSTLETSEARIKKLVQEVAPVYAQFGRELDEVTASRSALVAQSNILKERGQGLFAAAEATKAILGSLHGSLQSLHQQAKTLDYYKWYYYYTSYYYWYLAYYYYNLAGGSGYSPYYSYYAAYVSVSWAYWYWFGYFDSQLAGITRVHIPNLLNTIRVYEGKMESYRQQLEALKGTIESLDKQVMDANQKMHGKRQQILSTCMPLKGTGPAQCASLTGVEVL